MKFGMFLHQQRKITAEQLVAALAHQSKELPPIGLIALEEGRMAAQDVFRVLRVQTDLPHDRFGDIAVELGLLTKRDLAELLMLQSDRRKPIDKCVVELGFLTALQADEQLLAFRKSMELGSTKKARRIAIADPLPSPLSKRVVRPEGVLESQGR